MILNSSSAAVKGGLFSTLCSKSAGGETNCNGGIRICDLNICNNQVQFEVNMRYSLLIACLKSKILISIDASDVCKQHLHPQ